MRIVNLFSSKPPTPVEEFRKSAGKLREELRQNVGADPDKKSCGSEASDFIGKIREFIAQLTRSDKLDLTDTRKYSETVQALSRLYIASVDRPTVENQKQFFQAAQQAFSAGNMNLPDKDRIDYTIFLNDLELKLTFQRKYFEAQIGKEEHEELVKDVIRKVYTQESVAPQAPSPVTSTTVPTSSETSPLSGPTSRTMNETPENPVINETPEYSVSDTLTQGSRTDSDPRESSALLPTGAPEFLQEEWKFTEQPQENPKLLEEELKLSEEPQSVLTQKNKTFDYSVRERTREVFMDYYSESRGLEDGIYLPSDGED